MQRLAWIIDPKMPFRERVKLLRRVRRQYEAKLGEAEAQVIALKTALDLIDGALADYLGKPDMLGGKQGP